MCFTGSTLFLVLVISSVTEQQPMFFRSPFKGLNGVAPRSSLRDSEIRAVYYYEQTVAVVDLGANNELRNCDLIEVYEPAEADEVLRNLSTTENPQKVSLREMTKLMQQCELFDEIQKQNFPSIPSNTWNKGNRLGISSLTLLSGILPGTKWCGTGDIAENYHDLGQDAQIDRCCRRHDLCPVKVRAHQTRYNLTNYSLYTKSHCTCDEALYQCLKSSKHSTADIIGNIYFNLIKVPCIEDIPQDDCTIAANRRQFSSVKRGY